MSYHNTEEVTCPYCDYEFSESWEFQSDQDELECGGCDKKFSMTIEHTVEYSTRRLSCPGGTHVWESAHSIDTVHERNERYGKEKSCLYETDFKPNRLWIRDCENCEDFDYVKNLPIGAPRPWIEEPT